MSGIWWTAPLLRQPACSLTASRCSFYALFEELHTIEAPEHGICPRFAWSAPGPCRMAEQAEEYREAHLMALAECGRVLLQHFLLIRALSKRIHIGKRFFAGPSGV